MGYSRATLMKNKALSINRLSFCFGSKLVLNNIDIDLEEGCFHALLGPNGAGKSTLFSILTQLLMPQQGNIFVNGRSLTDAPRSALKTMGIVFQESTLDLDLTVTQNLSYHASLHGMSNTEATQSINRELARLKLENRADEKVRCLNGGHRRRVEIARALLHRPKLLLLDEPTVGLDLETREAINKHIRMLCREDGITALWATHLIDEIEMDDQVIILHHGKVQTHGICHILMELHQSDSLHTLFTLITEPKT